MLIGLSTACQGVCSLYPAAIVQVNVMRSETVQVATKTDPKLSLQLVIVLSFSVIVLIRAWTRRKHAELCASGCGHTVVDVVPLQLSGSSKPAAPNRVVGCGKTIDAAHWDLCLMYGNKAPDQKVNSR